ncbi:DUF1127 domain-containing protein [Bradyrhizobium nitroreducens]|uniref:DUF1127 domain-containing protein n=1 Tax=Bradyrhizobium nitroreducens TaxID=709803 RepID=UPI001FDEAD6E|nr:DUF1127 domain-containing protein [Bradyrhizobium nitroreducens]
MAARLKASAKALDNDAGRPTAASTAGLLGLLKRAWLAFLKRRQNAQPTLHDLSDRELTDIGLTRGEIDAIAPERAIGRLRDRMAGLYSRGAI